MWEKIKHGLVQLLFPYRLQCDTLAVKLAQERARKDSLYKQVKSLKGAMRHSTDPRLRGCVRKAIFESRELAQCSSELDGDRTRAYHCKYCKQWHLASRK